MDETTFRILNALSRELGRHVSINELKGKIAERYGGAYYANIIPPPVNAASTK